MKQDENFADPRMIAPRPQQAEDELAHGEIAPWPEQAWATVVALSVLGAAILLLILFVGGLHEATDIQFVCDESNCEIDSRPWARRHLWELGALAGCAVALVVALPAVRRLRRAAGVA